MNWFQFILSRHLQALLSTLGSALKRPYATMLTTLAIGVTLTLPCLLLLGVDHLRILRHQWLSVPSITVFLKPQVAAPQAQSWAAQLRLDATYRQVQFIHQQQALIEFQADLAFSDILAALGENPLPHVLAITLAEGLSRDAIVQAVQHLQTHAFTDDALWDQQWIDKLHGLFTIVEQAVLLLTIFFAGIVLLVLGNTLRLDIGTKQREIQIMKLLGATDTFVKRPFLYYGAWLGLFGGVLASLLTFVCVVALQPAITHFAQLSATNIQLHFFQPMQIGVVLSVSITLGYLGAWLAVTGQIADIEPTT